MRIDNHFNLIKKAPSIYLLTFIKIYNIPKHFKALLGLKLKGSGVGYFNLLYIWGMD